MYLSVIKCGNKKVKDPKAIILIPAEMYFGFEAPGLPPKYVIGTIAKSDPKSYDPATNPLCVESKPNLRSMVEITTLVNIIPWTTPAAQRQTKTSLGLCLHLEKLCFIFDTSRKLFSALSSVLILAMGCGLDCDMIDEMRGE